MTLTRAVEAKINSHYKFYKRLSIILLLLLLLVLSFVFLSYHGTPQDELSGFTPITQTTTLYPSNNTVYVDNNATTNVIVRITGANTNEGDQTGTSLSDSAYFIVNTTNCGSTKPQDANAPLAVEGQTAIGYYDVKVTTNMTLTPDVMVSVTITNPGVTANSIMYYWNTTQAQWLSVSTAFQPLHTVIGNFAALALTGTPIVVGNYISSTPTPTPSPSPAPTLSLNQLVIAPKPSPTPPVTLVAPEYDIGALLALVACLAAFTLFKIRKEHPQKTATETQIKS